jgi:hypothetical protein
MVTGQVRRAVTRTDVSYTVPVRLGGVRLLIERTEGGEHSTPRTGGWRHGCSSFPPTRAALGARLDALTPDSIHGLVASSAEEAHDLDFKVTRYGASDQDRRNLAGDVAALANCCHERNFAPAPCGHGAGRTWQCEEPLT